MLDSSSDANDARPNGSYVIKSLVLGWSDQASRKATVLGRREKLVEKDEGSFRGFSSHVLRRLLEVVSATKSSGFCQSHQF